MTELARWLDHVICTFGRGGLPHLSSTLKIGAGDLLTSQRERVTGVEQVVLLDEDGRATGVMDKAVVHHRATPLHLAFSCYVFNSRDEFLLTQRAHGKTTWPGIWTNSCCGHPAPGEDGETATRRRLIDELGVHVGEIFLALPRFRYRATMSNGIVENEMCPVFWARAADDSAVIRPNPDEVADTRWVNWARFSSEVLDGSAAISPWCEQQVRQLVALGPDPAQWPMGSSDDLPDAVR